MRLFTSYSSTLGFVLDRSETTSDGNQRSFGGGGVSGRFLS